MNQALKQAINHWKYIAPIVAYPRNNKEYRELVAYLDELLDIVADNEKHPLISLIDHISNIISSYEDSYFQSSLGKGIDALKYLMHEHQLRQCDFPEIGSQGVVSEILNGKRTLNLRQINLLAKRFNVNPATFID